MATTIRVRFEGSSQQYTASRWHIPSHDYPFEPMPDDVTCLIVPKTRLIKDAKFHSTHLADVEGLIVPIHYGMWLMDTGEWAGKVLFSITQWCGMSWNELSYTRMNTEANRILVGRTFEALHDYGVDHGGLNDFDNFRHVIIDIHAPGLSREDLLNGKAPCYITCFSEAHVKHSCTRRVPVLPLGSYISAEDVGCNEISDVLLLLDFKKRVNTRVSASQALEWHTKYSALYPDVDNMDALIAQRAKLYPEAPSVYEEHLTVSFDGDDEYSKAVIWRIAPVVSDEEQALAPGNLPASHSNAWIPDPDSDAMNTVVAKLERTTLEGSATALNILGRGL
ncbi:hypothetical protein MVEN_02006900 [Mycena venus]|uniref:Uncharacterized protein n=1 Tax=Mycena venus TaxID=2733690 RepID=A0A8H7CHQ6_9AGAR|nr:hypothetical protein MVEN_02006900 [Mycena venus]